MNSDNVHEKNFLNKILLEACDMIIIYRMFSEDELNKLLQNISYDEFLSIYVRVRNNFIILTRTFETTEIFISNNDFGSILSDAITNIMLKKIKNEILNVLNEHHSDTSPDMYDVETVKPVVLKKVEFSSSESTDKSSVKVSPPKNSPMFNSCELYNSKFQSDSTSSEIFRQKEQVKNTTHERPPTKLHKPISFSSFFDETNFQKSQSADF